MRLGSLMPGKMRGKCMHRRVGPGGSEPGWELCELAVLLSLWAQFTRETPDFQRPFNITFGKMVVIAK